MPTAARPSAISRARASRPLRIAARPSIKLALSGSMPQRDDVDRDVLPASPRARSRRRTRCPPRARPPAPRARPLDDVVVGQRQHVDAARRRARRRRPPASAGRRNGWNGSADRNGASAMLERAGSRHVCAETSPILADETVAVLLARWTAIRRSMPICCKLRGTAGPPVGGPCTCEAYRQEYANGIATPSAAAQERAHA